MMLFPLPLLSRRLSIRAHRLRRSVWPSRPTTRSSSRRCSDVDVMSGPMSAIRPTPARWIGMPLTTPTGRRVATPRVQPGTWPSKPA
eukprot:864885-Heterocapsa_arctica.AAC.1